MKINECKKVLDKSLDIIDIGIKKGYFNENKREELVDKLLTVFNNGIVYDIPNTKAIYAMYSPTEKKLYINAKVLKNETEALLYIIHELKHALDHDEDYIGFEHNNIGVGINEGATQRFATEMTEAILHKKIYNRSKRTLGIRTKTKLDEYQIEDKLNELFCMTMQITMTDFIRMQNTQKEFQSLIDKFNKNANYQEYVENIDKIYKIQEQNWFDENKNMLYKEKKPTIDQTHEAMELINNCKIILLKYAQIENPSVIDKIKEANFMAMNKYGEIVRDGLDEEIIPKSNEEAEIMSEENILTQANYLNYQDKILDQIDSNLLNNECVIIFITEFMYEDRNEEKTIYFRKGESYLKLIVPMNEDKAIAIEKISVQKVEDLNEIIQSIDDCEAEFGIIANGVEYSRLLEMTGNSEKAEIVSNKWDYFLSKKDEIEQIAKRVTEQRELVVAERKKDAAEFAASHDLFDMFDSFEQSIKYKNITISEEGITIDNDGIIEEVKVEEQKEYISLITNAYESGEISLNRFQIKLLEKYQENNLGK